MRGHITKRGKDSFTIVLNLGRDPATGKRKQQWVSVKGTKKDAEKKLAELLHQLDTGMFMKPGKTTLAEYLRRWLVEYVQPNLAPRTAEGYEHIIRRHLVPALGNLPLTQLKPEHVQRLYSQKLTDGRCAKEGGLSNRTVRYIHVTLHKALQDALRLGLVTRNVAGAVEPPRVYHQEVRTLGESDLQIFLSTAEPTPYYSLFYTALFTGMRRSELLALRWSDVDLLLCQLYVTRSMHQLKTGEIVFRQPKSTRSKRLVALSPSTVRVLADHKTRQEELKLLQGLVPRSEDLVFSHDDGTPLLPDSITHAWMKMARHAGLHGIRLHDARHTHASLMLKQGVHPKIVQEILGHSSIQVTLDTYSHVAPGLQQAAANRLDELLAKPEGESDDDRARQVRTPA